MSLRFSGLYITFSQILFFLATTAQLEGSPPPSTTKTSRAEITLKSATLPRRKPGKTEIQLEIKPRQTEPTMRFSTEMQHQVPDLRSAPVREGPYSPISTHLHQRATSVEPTVREHVIPIQRPSAYVRSDPIGLLSPNTLIDDLYDNKISHL